MPSRAGSTNKSKQALIAALRARYGEGFDPVMKMADHATKLSEIANELEDPNDIKMALDGWDKVAVYVTPKLKAVEVSGEVDNKLIVRIIDLTGSDGND